MIWMTLLIVLALAALAFIALPLTRRGETWETPNADTELDRLLAEKQRVLRTLKDVESEHVAGLMNQKDYDEARAEYMERAVDLNRDLAHLTGVNPTTLHAEGES